LEGAASNRGAFFDGRATCTLLGPPAALSAIDPSMREIKAHV
jgi:hypothetical protein